MYTRKTMAGTMFAAGRVSSFHLTALARHSVRRLLRRWLKGEVICRRAASTIYGAGPTGGQGICRPRRDQTVLAEGQWKTLGNTTEFFFCQIEVGLSRPVNPASGKTSRWTCHVERLSCFPPSCHL